MEAIWVFNVILFFNISLLFSTQFIHCSVSYDRKSIVIDGERRILLSGSIHYPRSTPDTVDFDNVGVHQMWENLVTKTKNAGLDVINAYVFWNVHEPCMWEDLITKAKNAGLDAIDTYVFWNVHEPSPGNYNFDGRYDLVSFIKTVQKVGLYVHLRVGPYVCAEWNFGGFPVWLKYVPGISFRTDNEPFKEAMQTFTQKIVGMMKSERLYQSQGGPIILSQIENEYGLEESKLGAAGKAYLQWAAEMAVGLDTGVPWAMCKENDAPDPIINTCNGFYCDTFSPNRPYKPTLWTEAWSGWFTEFGGAIHQRPVQDLAFAVASFIQRGGSFVNYYMFHGGTNFGRTAGGPFITTSYDYDAPIDEYGLIREPKYSHLQELHKAVKLCKRALVSADPTVTTLGGSQEAHVFSSGQGNCAAFLANYDTKSEASVSFNNVDYKLPPWSISILPDCKDEVFNTAKVAVQGSSLQMSLTNKQPHAWEAYGEDIYSLEDSSTLTAVGLLEQMNITRDSSDYLWYMTSFDVNPSESFLQNRQQLTLAVHSRGHALHVFVNGVLSGSAYGTRKNKRVTFTGPIGLQAGKNTIALLNIAVGLPNDGLHFETWDVGILGPVVLHGLDQGDKDLSWQKWTYKVGLKGELMNIISPDAVNSVEWVRDSSVIQASHPMTWYKGHFDAPEGSEPLALDMISMGKGQIWINGQSIGRYWTASAIGSCDRCQYAGKFQTSNCQTGCGQPTQRWYHVPRYWLKPTKNLLVVFEEVGGDVSKISILKRSMA